jgi:hypothetical protein
MASPVVYFYRDVSDIQKGASEFFRIISKDYGSGRVGLKVHFGEGRNDTFVRPVWLVDVKSFFPEAVFVECNVLYRGHRTVRKSHVAMAHAHGFDYLPVDILDGERGELQAEVPVNVGRTGIARLGGGLLKYDKLVAVSHFKGHVAAGFGGAFKNIGMGLGSRAGKMEMHSIVSPYVKGDRCVACGKCVRDCPVNAISLGTVASIDSGKCIGCAHCISVCPQAAIDIKWNMTHDVNRILMEKIAEYACAALKGRRWWFMNFITGVTFDCDCFDVKQEPFMEDAGILLSRDPVAVDQASLDLVKERNDGVDPFFKRHGVDGAYMLEYAEKIGLGKRKYELKQL